LEATWLWRGGGKMPGSTTAFLTVSLLLAVRARRFAPAARTQATGARRPAAPASARRPSLLLSLYPRRETKKSEAGIRGKVDVPRKARD